MAFQVKFIAKAVLATSLIFTSFFSPGQSFLTNISIPQTDINLALFGLFALILLGIAVSHEKAFQFSLYGSLSILVFKELSFPSFDLYHHMFGTTVFTEQLLNPHLRQGEWFVLLNIFGLLVGFAILASLFEKSGVPNLIPPLLPAGWLGPFVLLVIVFFLSSFLDNIASAMLGGTIAMIAFGRLHIGYLAAIVAASNAGGAGSVLGDTTTTMMWINGVSYKEVLHAYIAAAAALLFFGWFASRQQIRHQRFSAPAAREKVKVSAEPLLAVFLILAGAVAANVLFDMPALGVWAAILVGATFVKIPWKAARESMRGAFFLVGLIFAASLMPVEELPPASVETAFATGLVSAFFDNIPLTKICLEGGGFDWGILAYAVGFGGSMVWFGSSAGVALTSRFVEGRNLFSWLKHGWHIAVAYVAGFLVLYATLGWNPPKAEQPRVPEQPKLERTVPN